MPIATERPEAPDSDLASRFAGEVVAKLRCFDRVILHGTLVDVGHPGNLIISMQAAGYRPRDLTRFAMPITNEVRDHIIGLAREQGVEIEQVKRKNFRQEDRVAAILKQRGTHPGLVHVFAVKETSMVYDMRQARADGHALIIMRPGSCIHYYLYWMHPHLGLIHLRVPTWLPLRLQVYFNGHNWLAAKLAQANLSYTMADNAFSRCGDWEQAQIIADQLDVRDLHRDLDELVDQCVPVAKRFLNGYHWSNTQVEYAHDVVFKSQDRVDKLFDELARQSLLAIKAQDVARFLGKRLPMGHDTQVNSHFGRRHEGFRLKHSFGPASVKLYNKPGGILRMEMTTYDVTFFKHYRKVGHRDGTTEHKLAPLKKSIYSLPDLAEVMRAGVDRYDQWLSSMVEHTAGHQDLRRLSSPEHDRHGRSYRGFNPFHPEDEDLLQRIFSGTHALVGLTARALRKLFPQWTRSQRTRLLKRLRLHGLLRKIGRTYTYHVTALGSRVTCAILHLRNNVVVPMLTNAFQANG